MANYNPSTTPSAIPFYRDERYLNAFAQGISAILMVSFVIWLIINFREAAAARGLSLSFDFLQNPAGFPISDSVLEYNPRMSFSRAYFVGLTNTLLVSILGILAATILGTGIALARLSSNWLLSKLALAYIEFHQNIPLLVLLFIWKNVAFSALPNVKNSITIPGPGYLSIRGLYLTWPRLTATGYLFLAFSGIGLLLAIIAFYFLRRRRTITGKDTYYTPVSFAFLVGFSILGWLLAGDPFSLDVPVLEGFNFHGGLQVKPEFASLYIGLSMYTAAFIAEVVRSGIQAVGRGQVEAARAVGLNGTQVFSLVILPQALRVIIPPLISQYLNLTKNSSLALAIGFQELFSVGKIAINQAGRAVPVFVLVMATYLAISLFTSFALNWYNRRIQFVTR